MIELELPGARVIFSTRRGGVSEGPYESLNLGILTDDEPGRVGENRRRLAAAAGLKPSDVAMGWQVHGTELREWAGLPGRGEEDGFSRPGARLARVDGHLTDARGLGLLVLVADCLPVALSARRRIAMLHCGWRGLSAGIVERALSHFDEPPVAAIGPGIGPCCYEVGADVLEAFADVSGVSSGRMLDLRAIVRAKLAAAGIDEVVDVGLCTSCRADMFFSHRRDGGITGRQGGLVWRS